MGTFVKLKHFQERKTESKVGSGLSIKIIRWSRLERSISLGVAISSLHYSRPAYRKQPGAGNISLILCVILDASIKIDERESILCYSTICFICSLQVDYLSFEDICISRTCPRSPTIIKFLEFLFSNSFRL